MALSGTEVDIINCVAILPKIANPISIVLSGGTSLPAGFSGRFKQILDQLELPAPVGSVRMASQPIRSVAKGALVAASTR